MSTEPANKGRFVWPFSSKAQLFEKNNHKKVYEFVCNQSEIFKTYPKNKESLKEIRKKILKTFPTLKNPGYEDYTEDFLYNIYIFCKKQT